MEHGPQVASGDQKDEGDPPGEPQLEQNQHGEPSARLLAYLPVFTHAKALSVFRKGAGHTSGDYDLQKKAVARAQSLTQPLLVG